MKKLLYCLFILQILGITYAHAQAKKISGRVVDSSGQAIIGATIAEKGVAGNATSADGSGRFTLQLKGNSNRLVVSSVNYLSQEINTNTAAANLTIRLLPSKADATDDVVVVGYGRQKKLTSKVR